MRRALCAALLVVLAASASMDGIGVGAILGSPTGVTLKSWLGPVSALDLAAAWSLDDDESFHLHGDYLRHHFGTIGLDPGDGRLPLYYGIGARLVVFEEDDGGPQGEREDDGNDMGLGVRVPLGAAYLFEEAPVEIFLEVVPVLDLAPDTEMDLDAAIGGRVYL